MRKWVSMKFKKFVDWLVDQESWKGLAALVYLFICLFDFIVVPIWIGVTRPSALELLMLSPDIDTTILTQALQITYQQHQPFTLQGGAMFHLAFGAILTGSIIKGKLEPTK